MADVDAHAKVLEAYPVLKKWMRERVGPEAILRDARDNLPHVREALRDLPAAIRHLAEQGARGNLSVNVELQAKEIRDLKAELERQRKQRLRLTVAGVAAIVAAILLAAA